MPHYIFTSIADTFDFGKHKNESMSDVLERDPSYLYWCADKISQFQISEEALSEIRTLFPDFILSIDFLSAVHYEIDEEENIDSDENVTNNHEHATYERYAGSWAQDVEGYSDDDIDTVFDGDPSAYWNID